MAYFLEESLPKCIMFSSVYMDNYAVDIVESGGSSDEKASEYRRLVHPFPRRRFSAIKYHINRDDLYHQVLSLYHRCFGPFAGFRYFHHDDCSTAENGRAAPSAFDQELELISAGKYQMVKRYGKNSANFVINYPPRTIFKPIAGSTKVAVGATELVEGTDFTVDTKTGVVTITAAIPVGATPTFGTKFDLPVRFMEAPQIEATQPNYRQISIDLIELLNP